MNDETDEQSPMDGGWSVKHGCQADGMTRRQSQAFILYTIIKAEKE